MKKLIFIDTKNGLSNELTVLENLEAWVRMKGWNANKDNLMMALESVGMQNYINLYISQCSDGLRKRASLARLYFSFINKVNFWLLDEPTNELDDLSFLLFEKLITKFIKRKGTILIASHDIKSFNVNYSILDLDIVKEVAKP